MTERIIEAIDKQELVGRVADSLQPGGPQCGWDFVTNLRDRSPIEQECNAT